LFPDEEDNMVEANEYLSRLVGARMRAVDLRRETAMAFAETFQRGRTEPMRELFVTLQNLIEVIDRALVDEYRISETAGVRGSGHIMEFGEDVVAPFHGAR
jgi:hypothetical protein